MHTVPHDNNHGFFTPCILNHCVTGAQGNKEAPPHLPTPNIYATLLLPYKSEIDQSCLPPPAPGQQHMKKTQI